MQEINQNLIATFDKVLAVIVLQEYAKAAKNAKRKTLVAAYQGLKNY